MLSRRARVAHSRTYCPCMVRGHALTHRSQVGPERHDVRRENAAASQVDRKRFQRVDREPQRRPGAHHASQQVPVVAIDHRVTRDESPDLSNCRISEMEARVASRDDAGRRIGPPYPDVARGIRRASWTRGRPTALDALVARMSTLDWARAVARTARETADDARIVDATPSARRGRLAMTQLALETRQSTGDASAATPCRC